MKRLSLKLGSMRKAQDFVVYPAAADATKLTVQSDTRIATLDLTTGKAVLSKAHSSGSYFVHLSKFLGATDVDVPDDVLATIRASVPQSGDEIGPGVYVA